MEEKRELKGWVIPTAVILAIVIIFGAGFGVYKLFNTDKTPDATVPSQSQLESTTPKPDSGDNNVTTKPTEGKQPNDGTQPPDTKVVIKGYVNTYSGYTSLFAANGGNTTKPGSNFDKAGLDVDISIEDNDDNIIRAFQNGEIQFFAMTVNKMALVSKQLEDNGIQTVMPFFLDTSTGGDGIITDASVKNIADLKDVTISMAKNSVSTAIPVWFLNESGLSEEEIETVVNNFDIYNTTQEAVDAFLSGKVDAVSTWNISGALERANSHVLVSTASAEYLVIDGIVFNKKFADEHRDEILAMMDAILTTVNDINNGVNLQGYYDSIRQAVPDFADYSNEDMTNEISYAKFLGFNGNVGALDVANHIYTDFCQVWSQLGYKTNPDYKLIDGSYIVSLASKWDGKESDTDSSFSDNAQEYIDREALITQYAKILFNGDEATFKTGYEEINKELIDEFIKVAKILNKTIIKISGHVNLGEGSTVWDEATQSYKIAPGFKSSESSYILSYMRAETVKEYMVSQGIDEKRIIIEGLGGDAPIDTSDTEEGRANNRSCEISFYQAGY